MRAAGAGRGRRRAVLTALALVGAGAVMGTANPAAAAPPARVTVLSSAPDQVTGGDARIRVTLPPGLRGKARVLLNGDASNQVIWFTDGRPGRLSDQTPLAFEVIDEWMANRLAHPGASAAETKPAAAVDRCFDVNGNEIARGDGVWAGILDDRPAGACTRVFPTYETSRLVAGGPIRGGVYKCQLQSVDQAIARGLYGDWVPTAAERARLQQIFPTGVCDYTLPDTGRPTS